MRKTLGIKRVILAGLVFLLLAVSIVFLRTGNKERFFKVVDVIDGDTIVLDNERIARYIGIDTPETRRYSLVEGWIEDPAPFSKEALQYNRDLVLGKKVKIDFDVCKKDKYGRWLVYCFVDGVFVNAKLLEEGYAMLYTKSPNVEFHELFIRLFKKAREDQRGLWAPDKTVDSEDALDFVGSIRTVKGKVQEVKPGKKIVLIEFSKKKNSFKAVIFKEDLPYFLQAGIEPTEYFKNRDLKISGLIKEYHGSPEIIVRDPSQIEVFN